MRTLRETKEDIGHDCIDLIAGICEKLPHWKGAAFIPNSIYAMSKQDLVRLSLFLQDVSDEL